MIYHFIASDFNQKIIEEDIDAKSVEEVLSIIATRGLKPVSVRPLKRFSFNNIEFFGGRITITDEIFIAKYLSLMLKIGTGLLQAVNILLEDFSKPIIHRFLIQVRGNLEKGKPFYEAFEKYRESFSPVYINSIRAAETSGNLEQVFENMADSLSKEKTLRDQIRSALFYPLILLISSIGILFFLVMFALPKIAGVFSESGFQPPLFSRVVFGVGLFLGKFGFLILIFIAVLVACFFIFYKYFYGFRRFFVTFFSSLPIIEDIIKKISLQRFAATLSSLIKAGMPITEALEITAGSITQLELREALLRISREGISKGLTIGEAFRREPFFPKTVVNLVAISEHAGHIEEVLKTLADFYVSEIDNSLKTLVSFLEPIMLVFIGLVVGIIALSIVIPIYQLTVQF